MHVRMDENEKKMKFVAIILLSFVKDTLKKDRDKGKNEVLRLGGEDNKKGCKEEKKKKGERKKVSLHIDPQLDNVRQLLKESLMSNNYFTNHVAFNSIPSSIFHHTTYQVLYLNNMSGV